MLASAVVGGAAMLIITSSVEVPQAPLVMVHLNVLVEPTLNPVIVVVGEVAAVIVAVPDVTLHAPLPATAVLPDN